MLKDDSATGKMKSGQNLETGSDLLRMVKGGKFMEEGHLNKDLKTVNDPLVYNTLIIIIINVLLSF